MRSFNGFVVIDENDIGKTDGEILMDLIYEHTRQRIPEEYITYGLPQALDYRPDREWDANTYIPVKISAEYSDRFNRQQSGFMYRRRTFEEYFRDVDFTVQIQTFPFRVKDLVQSDINPHVPYPLDPEKDVLDYEFRDRESETFRLIAHPNSLIWAGGTDILMDPIDPEFFKLVANPYLPGFVEYFSGS